MDQVGILTTSRVEPSVSINRNSDALAYLSSTLPYATVVHHALGSVSLFLCMQAYVTACAAFSIALYASKILAFQAYIATKYSAYHARIVSAWALAEVYRSKTLERLRKKLFFEFATFVLGGCGNGLFLVVFWPGWIVIGGASFAMWQVVG
ncbi:hypothetical protein S40285_10108 [Stachybotrys chlorohalonatus IBT 40285]|uniref:Uncharacterized protein n=1 Tax=Stachybotrys chlorohalonatus (strain IBT 40285) TaxID=1283841 RepID=A0A084QCP0_STAC4|nr:hypothetical protein S40285_10108 [Stachybotrys chlorohalonata IBT 40285]